MSQTHPVPRPPSADLIPPRQRPTKLDYIRLRSIHRLIDCKPVTVAFGHSSDFASVVMLGFIRSRDPAEVGEWIGDLFDDASVHQSVVICDDIELAEHTRQGLVVVDRDAALTLPEVRRDSAVLETRSHNDIQRIKKINGLRGTLPTAPLFPPRVTAYTDGSFMRRRGAYGIGVVTTTGGYSFGGGSKVQSSTEAEIIAAHQAMSLVPRDRDLTIVLDSRDAITMMRTALALARARKVVSTMTVTDECAEELFLPRARIESIELLSRFASKALGRNGRLDFKWVRGHSSSSFNDQADRIARTAARAHLAQTGDDRTDEVVRGILEDGFDTPFRLDHAFAAEGKTHRYGVDPSLYDSDIHSLIRRERP